LECEFIVQEPRDAPIRVLALTPAGPAEVRIGFDVPREELERLIEHVRDDYPDLEARKKLGRILFRALVPKDGPVREAWDNTKGRLTLPGAVLRLRLWVEPAELSRLPWELMCEGDSFLAARGDVFVSRYLPGPEPRYFPAAPDLRILVVVAEGGGLTPVDQAVLTDLRSALDALVIPGRWKELRNPDVGEVVADLRRGFHVLHFVGHGHPGSICWVRPSGQRQDLTAEQVGQVVVGHQQLRLVLLNACGSGEPGAEPTTSERFRGVGETLIQSGVPAVIAM
jgi:hypothetical protein